MANKKEVLKKKVVTKTSKKKQVNSKANQKIQKKTNRKKTNSVNKTKITKNVIVEQKNIEKTEKNNENKEKIVNKDVDKKELNLKSDLKKIIKYLDETKKIWLLTIFITIIVLVVVTNLRETTGKIFLTFNSYSIGEEVILKDNSKWYVVEESSSAESTVKLLSSSVVDVNNDKKIDDNDKVAFDSSNACEYDTKNDKNIGYFLNNKYADKLKSLTGIKEIRLLNSEEYILIRNTMEFGYDWENGNFLANSQLHSWWLETSKYNKIYVVTERGSYRLSKASSKNYIRPVVIIEKENIKK